MSQYRRRYLMNLVAILTIVSMLVSPLLPIIDSAVQAQDTTETPAPPTDTPTETATDTPTETATDAATEAPTDAVTETPSETATDTTETSEPSETPTDVPTETPTALPTQPPTVSVFQDDFQDANADGWLLTPGWQIGVEGDNLFLTTTAPNETATIDNLSLADFSFAARVRMDEGNAVNIAFRAGAENYTLHVDALGSATLYRNADPVAQGQPGVPAADGIFVALWHTINIYAAGGQIVISINGTPQIIYTDANPLLAGTITISSDAANIGAISVDQVSVGEPELPVITTPETAVPSPEETATSTEEATVVPLPTEEQTPEATAEATTEPVGTLLLSADFESDLIGLTASEGASVVSASDTNHALLLAAGSSLSPTDALYLTDFSLDAKFNILSDSGDGSLTGVTTVFRGQEATADTVASYYALRFEVGQTALYRVVGDVETLLISVPADHALNTWHSVSLKVVGGQITVTTDGAVELDYADAEPLAGGNVGLLANAGSSVLVDDISLTDSASPVIELTPTATPYTFTDAERAKLPDQLIAALELALAGDTAGAAEAAKYNFIALDEEARVYLTVWASEGSTVAAITPIVEAVGGIVDTVGDQEIEARVPINGIVPLVNAPEIGSIDLTTMAMSTSSTQNAPAVNAPGTGAAVSEGYDVVSANDWNNSGITGTSVRIGVIDTGFVSLSTTAAVEKTCLQQSPAAVGGTNHGTQVIQVICDIAPNSDVYAYQADTALELKTAVNSARTAGMNIILITMDLGITAAPGDGTDGDAVAYNAASPASAYDAIRKANEEGRLVIISAGNNNGRMASFNYTAGNVSIPIIGDPGDRVWLSWNDWDSVPNAGGAREDLTFASFAAATDPTYNGRGAGNPVAEFTLANGSNCVEATPCTLTITGKSGNAASLNVQVQVADGGSIGGDITGVTENVTSTIGRPGDSAYALTVGAVCWSQAGVTPDGNYSIISDSSHGPIFGNGGGAPAAAPFTSRASIKPDLVGPSHVSTSFDVNAPAGDTGINTGCDDATDGFNGTSAAAAHVAGMAALVRANTNVNIGVVPAGTVIGAVSPAIRQNLTDYLQSHTIDLYSANGSEPDGFDTTYGAGLTTLGNPKPVSPISVDPSALTDAVCANPRYVSNYKLSGPERVLNTLGTRTNPYIHIAQALALAPANSCVVVLPGEYVTGIYLDDTILANGVSLEAYQYGLPDAGDSQLWINNSQFSGGIAMGNSSTIPTVDFSILGFKITRSNPFVQRCDNCSSSSPLNYPPDGFNPASAIVISYATGTITIERNEFTLYDDGNINTPNKNFSTPVVLRSVDDTSVRLNKFYKNDSDTAGVLVTESGSGTTIGATIQYNSFENNTYSTINTGFNPSVILINESTANILSNRFTANSTTSIITIRNTNDPASAPFTGANEVNVLGNAIFSNANTGPVVKLDPARRFRFSNNTVANNTLMSLANIIERGNSGSPANFEGALEINSNVFFGNSSVLSLFEDKGGNALCYNFSGTTDQGMKNNWSDSSGGTGGDCVNSLSGFNNRFASISSAYVMGAPDTADSVFVGTAVAPDDPYQLRQETDPSGTPVLGIDAGDAALVPGFFTAVGSLDPLGKPRVDTDAPTIIDIGAYEYSSVQALPILVTVNEDSAPIQLNMNNYVVGGFGPFSFEVLTAPPNYATGATTADPANTCNGQAIKQQYNPTLKTTTFFYCMPDDFYTVGAPAGSTASFTYRIRDNAGGTSDPATATININPVDDANLVTPQTYSVVVAGHEGPGTKPVTFRLRPYARFNNYRIVRPNDESDYPYDYTFGAVTGTPGQNSQLINGSLATAVNNADATGLVTVNLNPNEVGFVEFTYNATDANGGGPVSNTIKLITVASLPDNGLHDDTSFAFTYRGATDTDQGFWNPAYSEININNTLHTSATLNDTAEFLFNGAAFALYMQGNAAGGYWELQIDNGGGTPVRFPWSGQSVVTADGITCRTSALTGVATTAIPDRKYQISNKIATAYVVSCSGLIEGEPNTVRIINREARALSVDAIGIYNDSLPLLTGFHEVTETQLLPLFLNGWTQVTDAKASGQKAVFTKDANVANVTFRFQGTGFALGTTLEMSTKKLGATYRICVAQTSAPDNQICQSFDNGLGAATTPVWGTYRPFFGFDPAFEYLVTIDITDIPVGARMVIDSLVVFDQQPSAPLPLGTTEDDQVGKIVFGNGVPDTWLLDANNTRTSNKSLTSIIATVNKAGPFVSFQIPANADTIIWKRLAGTTDTLNLLVCVDRGQFEILTNTCKEYTTLRTVGNNPLTIKESDFASGWGTGFGASNTHTIEIFSKTNFPFNLDNVQVIDSTAALVAGNYEQNVPNLKLFNNNAPTYSFVGSSFTTLTSTLASGGSYVKTVEGDEGGFFRFTGTGFSVLFDLDRYSANVQICWQEDAGATATVNTVLTTGVCQTISNAVGTATIWQAARTFVGLKNSTYAVVVQNKGINYNPANRTGNTMQLDGMKVYNEDWSTLTALTTGTRYETSFVNRVTDNRFLYYGATWRSFSGTAAKLYSGSNYDNVVGFGSSVVFRTTGGNVVRIVRDIRAGYSPLLVCSVPSGAVTPYSCQIVRNDGGTANQQIFNVPLSSTGAQVVSITTLTGGILNLDAIEVANSASTLTAGTYLENDPRLTYTPLNNLTTGWRNLYGTAFLDRGGMQSTADAATLTFSFSGTGFSLFTLFEATAGTLNVTLNGTGGNDYSYTTRPELVFNNTRTAALYGSSQSITGLPFDTYSVTIAESSTDAKNKFTVDGIQIYGAFASGMTPGFYDDPATISGQSYINYGPYNAFTARSTAGYLNLTNRIAARFGANISFQVSSAAFVTLYHSLTNSTNLRVCAKPAASVDGETSWKCATTNNPATRSHTTISLNNTAADIQLNAGGVGDYIISITNLTHGTNFIVDGIQVAGATAMASGIYQDAHPLITTTGSWTNRVAEPAATDKFVKSTGTGAAGDVMQFQFTGTGFSIVLVESTATSATYNLCVESGGSCNVIASTPLVPVGASASKRTVALTYVGFTSGTYTVKLTNNDAAKPLLVDRVDILGTLAVADRIANDITGNVENTDARIVYLPYYSFGSVANAAASGGSQHISAMQGSVVYFELNAFAGTALDYVRQTLGTYGSTTLCSNTLGTNSTACANTENILNNVAPFAYQRTESVDITTGGNRWVILRNDNGKSLPFDYIRPTVAGAALTAGTFEETHPALQYFTEASGTGAGPYTVGSSNFISAAVPLASGGSVNFLSADAGSVGNGLYEGVLFQFKGRGFGVKFSMDAKSDAVKICWTNSLTTNVSTVLGGTCETFDNQSSAARYQAMRMIYGLGGGNYTAVVQMLPDNLAPAAHAAAALPLSMQIDAVQVFDEDWTGLTPLVVGTKTDTNYTNRVTDDRFLYFGNGWKTVVGTAAKAYFGTTYDSIVSGIGASVSFRVDNANAINLFRDAKAGYAPIEVCASPEGTLTQRYCTRVNNNTSTGISQPARVFLDGAATVGDYIVTITTLDVGIFNLDAVQPVNSTLALLPGLYEDSYPGLSYTGVWTQIFATTYSGGTAMQTSTVGDEMTFSVDDASGFEIAIPADRFGGEVEVCYDTNNTWGDAGDNCYTYQQERTAPSYAITRTVTGLTVGTQYFVRVKNVEDGFTALVATPNTPRPAAYNPARMRIDYVQVFGDALPPAVAQSGLYNENATNGSAAYLQFTPSTRWLGFSGTAAKGFSNLTYTTVVDAAKRVSAAYAGPTVTLRLTVPAGGATVILYTGPAATTNTDQLLVCANKVDDTAGNCTVVTTLRANNQVVVNSSQLTALGAAGTVTLSFRALTPGAFRVDGFQVIQGTTLVPGIYDNFLIANAGLINTSGTTWTVPTKATGAYGGTVSLAQSTASTADDPTLQFTFDGTGFGIVTLADATGVDVRICYVASADFDGTFDGTGTEICETVTTDTNTTPADWNTKNDGRPRPTVGNQYTFGYYGLADDTYIAQVRMIDTVLAATDRLKIDGVVIFSDVTNGGAATPLSAGQIYDQNAAGISYEAGVFWTTTTSAYGPTRGPWRNGDIRASNAGALTQLYVDGNALIVYQSTGATGSRNVRVCVNTIEGLDCTEYSQYLARATYFTPVIFYGLGTTSVHIVTIENRDSGRPLNLDAFRVLE